MRRGPLTMVLSSHSDPSLGPNMTRVPGGLRAGRGERDGALRGGEGCPGLRLGESWKEAKVKVWRVGPEDPDKG